MFKRFLLVGIPVLLASGCKHANVEAAKPADPPAVTAAAIRIQLQPFAAVVPVTGSLVSNARVDVKAETTGRVARFPKEEGDRVAAGEPLLWVDEENYTLAVRQAESSVQVAQAALGRTRVLASHSKTELDRAENLLQSGGITDKDHKLAQVTEQEARSQVALAEAQLAQAQAALDVARKRLRDAVVKAPVSGEIQRKFVNAGAYVEPPTAVVTIVDNNRLELESSVPASDLGPLRPGQRVTFTVTSFPGESFEGRVIETGAAVDSESRAAKVRIAISSAGKLKSGMFAQGEIQTGVERQAIVIPAAAVYRDDRSAKDSVVYVIDNGKAVKRPVRIGRERESSVEIVSGLHAGDMLIAEQSIEIADGVKVVAREGGRVSQ
jgi:RND family efflux transporter MFP subunit